LPFLKLVSEDDVRLAGVSRAVVHFHHSLVFKARGVGARLLARLDNREILVRATGAGSARLSKFLRIGLNGLQIYLGCVTYYIHCVMSKWSNKTVVQETLDT